MIKVFLNIITILFVVNVNATTTKIRSVLVQNDQIIAVKTSLGIATIIQVPDPPHSVVVGDQNSFKVEYLGNALTIKPLSNNAKSNLYIYTDWKRYNVQLITTDESNADYVVYLKNPVLRPKIASGITEWFRFQNEFSNDNLKFKVVKVGLQIPHTLLIDFELTSKEKIQVSPDWFWLIQKGRSKTIYNLLLSDLNLEKGNKINGTIQILTKDIDENLPLRLELRRRKLSFLTISKVSSWKTLGKIQSY